VFYALFVATKPYHIYHQRWWELCHNIGLDRVGVVAKLQGLDPLAAACADSEPRYARLEVIREVERLIYVDLAHVDDLERMQRVQLG
jgi:hypothetical protein